MTQEEYVRKYRDELFGVIADAAATARSGANLGLFLRDAFRKVNGLLVDQYRDLAKPPGRVNGKPLEVTK